MPKPQSINKLLNSLIASKGWKGRVEIHKVFTFWDNVVGPDIAKQAQPYVIRQNILWVNVTDSVWMQQLHLLKEMLLEKLNKRIKKEKLADIRFQLDVNLVSREKKEGDEPAVPVSLPDPARVDEFDHMLESIEDEHMRDAIRKCWIKTGASHRGKVNKP